MFLKSNICTGRSNIKHPSQITSNNQEALDCLLFLRTIKVKTKYKIKALNIDNLNPYREPIYIYPDPRKQLITDRTTDAKKTYTYFIIADTI